MQVLHKQALPFMMRRLKEDVLDELPPKTTQDYYCELSPLQRKLYDDFLKDQQLGDLNEQNKGHVFQSLQYLRLVCNHPSLVLRPQNPQFAALSEKYNVTRKDLTNINLSAKLPALKSLLLDCGIGASDDASILAPHRVLIFCQLRTMIEIIERDLFREHMPSVTYLRLDGTVPAAKVWLVMFEFDFV